MNRLLLLLLLIEPLLIVVQSDYRKVTVEFIPSFHPTSTLIINFKKSKGTFRIDGQGTTYKFCISKDERELLTESINSLSNNLQPRVDSISIDNKLYVLDLSLTEDGMMIFVQIEKNNKQSADIQLGNSYSKVQVELIAQLANFLLTKTKSEEQYLNNVIDYLN